MEYDVEELMDSSSTGMLKNPIPSSPAVLIVFAILDYHNVLIVEVVFATKPKIF